MDAPLPGIGPWEEVLKSPLLWHFRFGGPDMERLVTGRERIYLDRFWNEFSADPKSFGEAARQHYAKLYAQPGAMHAGFNQFAAFDQDAIDNMEFLAKGKLTMPVLAIGGEKSFGPTMAVVMRAAATNVEEVVIAASGHWLMEEQPAATVAAVRAFLDKLESHLWRNQRAKLNNSFDLMVLPGRIELTTSPLPRECSTTELRQPLGGGLLA